MRHPRGGWELSLAWPCSGSNGGRDRMREGGKCWSPTLQPLVRSTSSSETVAFFPEPTHWVGEPSRGTGEGCWRNPLGIPDNSFRPSKTEYRSPRHPPLGRSPPGSWRQPKNLIAILQSHPGQLPHQPGPFMSAVNAYV